LDNINAETIELLEPYLNLQTNDGISLFTPENAKKASMALAGLCSWITGIVEYCKVMKGISSDPIKRVGAIDPNAALAI